MIATKQPPNLKKMDEFNIDQLLEESDAIIEATMQSIDFDAESEAMNDYLND